MEQYLNTGYIYKITNLVNNKIYIGKTEREVESRWNEHKSKARKNQKSYLYNAIRKYGEQNFIIETIEKVDVNSLSDREKYWIEFFKSNNKEIGYNLTKGGDGNLLYNYNLIRQYWDDGKTIKEIKELMGCDPSVIQNALYNYKDYNTHNALSRSAQKFGVNQYDLNGNFIQHFDSISDANKYLMSIGKKNSETSICNCCKNKQSQSNGYIWTYDTDNKPNVENRKIVLGKRKILQYSLNGEFLKEYESAAAAAREIEPEKDCNMVGSQILQVCKGNRKSCRGYIWQYGK